MSRTSNAISQSTSQPAWPARAHPDEHTALRVLFTTIGLTGHFHPLVPFAWGLAAAGHAVAFATTPHFVAAIEAAGFRCFAVGSPEPPAELVKASGIDTSRLSHAELLVFAQQWFYLGEHKRHEIHDLLAIIAEWQPDLIVREDTEFAGCVAAERAGLPHAAVQIHARGLAPTPRAVSPPRLNALRVAVGLPPDPDLASCERYLFLCPFPPSLRHADAFIPPTQHVLQPALFDQSNVGRLPGWVAERPDRPLVYATLGTAWNHRTDVFEKILAGLRDEPLELVVTVGRDQDPAQFEGQPPNVHLARYIPQSLLYTHCDVVVMHGGSGTMIGALWHGLPLVMIPLSADQPANAQAAQAAGVARVLDPAQMTPEDVRAAVRAVLTQSTYRDNARRLQAESRALPEFAHGVSLLERLARTRMPLHVS